MLASSLIFLFAFFIVSFSLLIKLKLEITEGLILLTFETVTGLCAMKLFSIFSRFEVNNKVTVFTSFMIKTEIDTKYEY